MKRYVSIILALVSFLLMGFAKDEVRQDMVKFDKIYIAALALTTQGKVVESRKVVGALQQSWQGFRDKYYEANPGDKQWKGDFDAVGGMVAKAGKIVASDSPVTEAHEALEHVREVLMKLRQRNRIEYFIDGLTVFHEPMEVIVLAAKDKTGDTLTDADVGRIRKALPQAEKAWQRVTSRKLDAGVYQLAPPQADEARSLMAKETAALKALKDALASKDKARIAQAAVAVKPNFAKLFMAFADFAPYRP